MFARRIALMVGLVGLGADQSGSAQRVSADIHIGSGPVGATIRLGDRPDYRIYGRPRRAYAEVVRPVRVYQDDRRFYRYNDFDRYDRDQHRGNDQGRGDRDWYYERNGNGDESRWEHDHQHCRASW